MSAVTSDSCIAVWFVELMCLTMRGPMRKETATPITTYYPPIPVANVLSLQGNQLTDIVVQAPMAAGPANPFKKCAMYMIMVAARYDVVNILITDPKRVRNIPNSIPYRKPNRFMIMGNRMKPGTNAIGPRLDKNAITELSQPYTSYRTPVIPNQALHESKPTE